MKKYVFIFIIFSFIFIGKICAYFEYDVGDKISYNGVDYYVIKKSIASDESVTLMKADPLTVDEVNRYGGVGTTNNHVNINVSSDASASYYQTAYDSNGYGGMAYYASATCRTWTQVSGCTTDYEDSELKYVVDAWAKDKIPNGLQEARLITLDELFDNLGYKRSDSGTIVKSSDGVTPDWVYNNKYTYWTMDPLGDSISRVRAVHDNGSILDVIDVFNYRVVVRPVIVLKKDVFEVSENLISYNNVKYYIIKKDKDTVTLLKAKPITSVEIKDYLSETEVANKVDISGKYASMAYYSSSKCFNKGYTYDSSGCITDYTDSDIKQVVDIWVRNYTKFSDVVEARLINEDDLFYNLGYDWKITSQNVGEYPVVNENVPDWLYDINYSYWTMYIKKDLPYVFDIAINGMLGHGITYNQNVIRPVIVLKRSVLGEEEITDIKDDNAGVSSVTKGDIATDKVKVPNTYLKKSLIIIIFGFIFACSSIVIYYIIKKKYSERK